MAGGCLAALLVVLASSPLWIIVTHAVLARLLPRSSPQIVAVAAGLVGLIPTFLLAGAVAAPGFSSMVRMPVEVAYTLIVYACIAYSYFHLFNLSETARRIRILRELHAAGSLTAAEISRLYSPTLVLEVRLDRLVAAGQLKLRGGRYVNAGRLLRVAARAVRAWRLVLGFE